MSVTNEAPRSAARPLSSVQRVILLQSRIGARSANTALALRVLGPLDHVRLEMAVERALARHEILRAVYPECSEEALLGSAPTQTLTRSDLTCEADDSRDRRLERLLVDAAAEEFDPAAGPLIRFRLIQQLPQRHTLLLHAHPIAADERSLELLANDIMRMYFDGTADLSPARQFWDFARWERQLAPIAAQGAEQSWRDDVESLDEPTVLLPDRPRSAIGGRRVGVVARELSPAQCSSLADLAARCGAGLDAVVLTGFVILLSLVCARRDVLLAVRSERRARDEDAHVIGPFSTTTPLRLALQDSGTFSDVLMKLSVRLEAGRAGAFPQILELASEHAMNGTAAHALHPPIVYSFDHADPVEMESAGVLMRSERLAPCVIFSEIELCVRAFSGALAPTWIYASELFDESTIERLHHWLETILEEMVIRPGSEIGQLSLLTAFERETLLVEWNRTAEEFPTCRVHELIDLAASRTPSRAAVSWEGGRLDYAGLTSSSNRLANHLAAAGVSPGDIVGLCVERSPDMIVALLAILKAGGVYLPLDPSYPADRLNFMLLDSQARLLVASEAAASALQAPALPTVLIDGDAARIAEHSSEPPEVPGAADAPIYLIYTSGSTGRPKGVSVEHRSVVNFLVSMSRLLRVRQEDVVAFLASLSFDISALEIFMPLINGAAVAIVPAPHARDGRALQQDLRRLEASIVQGTPSTWRLILGAGAIPPGVRTALCGGEALTQDLAAMLRGSGADAWNVYGPTETTIWSSAFKLEPGRPIAIGRPIANTLIYVLDDRVRPVPVGVPGEIYIGGCGVARGYLNRPDLTEQRFLPDPFSSEPGARMYRTGDLGRHLSDGNIQYLGRADRQVKINGVRIEPAEIEAALNGYPGVRESVAIVREEGVHKRLVAYVVADRDATVEPTALRSFLHASLPEHMIPRAVVLLEALPLTPSGKVDRTALPAPDGASLLRASRVAPASRTEKALVRICTEVLQVEDVSVLDDLFDLGANSLSLLQVAMRIQEELGVEVPLRWGNEFPTLRRLAEYVDKTLRRHRDAEDLRELEGVL